MFTYDQMYNPGDFGLPPSEDVFATTQAFEGQLPSIKMTKETILSHWPKPGPSMHDP